MIINGDALSKLKELETESIDLVATSPPYYGLRNYGMENQIGLEKTPQLYINNLMNVFNECKRVLKKTGSCWVNIGDTYASQGGLSKPEHLAKANVGATKAGVQRSSRYSTDFKSLGILEKSLMGIPERFVLAMMNNNWIRRNTIIWHKSNCMPSPTKDRFTIDFEYFYFWTKNKNYYFETQYEQNNRIKRTVWNINLQPLKQAHFAVFPEKLIETPIKACCPPNDGTVLDPFCGAGTTLLVAKKLGRKYIGIELNKEYCKISQDRLDSIL